jgi:hypothetical protein
MNTDLLLQSTCIDLVLLKINCPVKNLVVMDKGFRGINSIFWNALEQRFYWVAAKHILKKANSSLKCNTCSKLMLKGESIDQALTAVSLSAKGE